MAPHFFQSLASDDGGFHSRITTPHSLKATRAHRRSGDARQSYMAAKMRVAQHSVLSLLLLLNTWGWCSAQKLPLTTWSFQSHNGSVRIENASVPGTSHMHLLDAGVIEDPYLRFNEREYEWIAKETWVYEARFVVDDKDTLANSKLVFEKLDGITQIYVNGEALASTLDSFMSYTFGVAELLVRGENAVKVVFTPALDYALSKVRMCNHCCDGGASPQLTCVCCRQTPG